MENIQANYTISTRLKILLWEKCLYGILSYFFRYFQPLLNFVHANHKAYTKTPNVSKELQEKVFISRAEIEMVMDRLGVICSLSDDDADTYHERYYASEVSRVFEEEEPSLEEVKEAFDIFDENKDGFIDAKELQRVLLCLGFKEGSQWEKCRRMIRAVNIDDRINFNEFVLLMHKCFC